MSDDALSEEEIGALLDGADDLETFNPEENSDGGSASAVELKPLAPVGAPLSKEEAESKLDLLDDVSLNVKIELGRTKMSIQDVLRLNEGSIVGLEKLSGDPADILVNNKLVAKGQVLVLNENFSIRITEIISMEDRLTFEKKQSFS